MTLGEAECTAEQKKAVEARERLSEDITAAGCQQNEARSPVMDTN